MTATAASPRPAESAPTEVAERILRWAGTPEGRRSRAQAAAAVVVQGDPPGRRATPNGPGPGERRGRPAASVVLSIAGNAVAYACFIAAWGVAGRAALTGRFEPREMAAFLAASAGLVAGRWSAARAATAVAVAAGAWLKRRTLRGALALDRDAVSRRGAGELLGVTLEADALESLALGGGQIGIVAAAELVAAAAVLGAGAGRAALGPLLAWLAAAGLLAGWYHRRRRSWTAARLDLTADLVEQLVGHRTRLAQGRHADHGGDLDAYRASSQQLDRAGVLLLGLVPRGWLLTGLAVAGSRLAADRSAGALVAVGGVLLAWHALDKLVHALTQLLDASVAWTAVAPLVRQAATPTEPEGEPEREATVNPGPLLAACDLSFAHRDRSPVLSAASVSVAAGDRIVLTGPSGAGKSTLAAILAGLRQPDGGSVHRSGRVVLAPQHHENHVLSASVAFNLLLGQRWPPTPDDLRAATEVCRDLGLGGLLDEMPGGLGQPIGECGWQLSQGQQARLFIARALLQQPDLLILDESLAPLDPESQHLVVNAVLARVPAVVVVAHP